MKRIRQILIAVLVILLAAFTLTACRLTGVFQKKSETDAQGETGVSADVQALSQAEEVQIGDITATITLNGDSAAITGSGVEADGTTVRIGSAGVYQVSGTLTDGRIVVDADDSDVTIVLNNASITSESTAAIYVYRAKTATVYAQPGTTNSLTDGETYDYSDAWSSEADEEPNACLYSKADLVIAGSGALTVNGRLNNGVTGKDTLRIETVQLTVDAKNHGVTGKDSLAVKAANVTVTCAGDALRSTNDKDTSLGTVTILDATLKIDSGEDGIQAETAVSLSGTTADIRAGGGSSATVADDASAKGVKAGTDITIDGGKLTLNCAEDGVHADNNVSVRSGTLTIECADDGIHADNTLTIEDGEIKITAHEGLEATLVTINDGKLVIEASDDGINAAQKVSGVTPTVTINGGEIEITMGQGDTDGVDANGDILINGGTIRVTGQSAFDYDGKGEINGGTVYVNGEQVTTLPNQFGGGMGGGFGGERQDGERPEMPDGERPEMPDGERPEMPDGEPPELPDGMTPPDGENGFGSFNPKDRGKSAASTDTADTAGSI